MISQGFRSLDSVNVPPTARMALLVVRLAFSFKMTDMFVFGSGEYPLRRDIFARAESTFGLGGAGALPTDAVKVLAFVVRRFLAGALVFAPRSLLKVVLTQRTAAS